MRTFPLDQLGSKVGDLLAKKDTLSPVLLTEKSQAVGLLVPMPEGVKESDIDVVSLPKAKGEVLLLVEVRSGLAPDEGISGQPVFGSCRGMLEIISEDDEHLKDFAEYMK